MAGPKRQYDINIEDLPPYPELVQRLQSVDGIGHRAAHAAASWVELHRAGIDQPLSHVTEIRYRRHLCAAMGVPVPPKPGRKYEADAEPIRDAGYVELAGAGAALVGAVVALASVHPIGHALAPILALAADNVGDEGYDALAVAA